MGHMDFQKIAKVNRYIELRNPFPRIENPFSGIAIRSLEVDSSFSLIEIRSLELFGVKIEGTNCNLR